MPRHLQPREGGAIRRHHGRTAGHGFECGETEPFVQRRVQERPGRPIERRQVGIRNKPEKTKQVSVAGGFDEAEGGGVTAAPPRISNDDDWKKNVGS